MMSTPDSLTEAWLDQRSGCSWADLPRELAGLRICWTDDLGIHVTDVDALPAQAPPTCTHIWGWSPTRLARVRIDNTRVWLAILHLVDTPGAEPVTCRMEGGLAWRQPEGDSAMMRLAADTDPSVLDSDATACTVIDGPRLSFLTM